jgi:cellobiose phosphorylase
MFKITNDLLKKEVGNEKLKFLVLPSGDLFAIQYQNHSISMYKGTTLDGMMANIYLRVTKNNETFYTRLLGVNSPSKFQIINNQINYTGVFLDINYHVNAKIIDQAWFWTVNLSSSQKEVLVELFYGQDISLNSPHANEPYVCQYLDHRVMNTENGYCIVTKQNQGPAMMIQQGSLTETKAYATDGFQFFGTDFKLTNEPKVLKCGDLPSENYQYELAYIALQTPKVKLDQDYQAVFYAYLTPNYHETNQKVLSEEEISAIYNRIPSDTESEDFEKVDLAVSFQKCYPFQPFTKEELDKLFPNKKLVEKDNEHLLSWFDDQGTHFVTGHKEGIVERPHGSIIINNGMHDLHDVVMTSTNWIYGVFYSQVAIGNSSFHKFISSSKNALNIMKASGGRLFIKVDKDYYLLSVPAVFEMTFNATTWYYKIKDDILKIEVAIDVKKHVLKFKARSLKQIRYDFILVNHLAMGNDDYTHPIHAHVKDKQVSFTFDPSTLSYKLYPEYHYVTNIETDGAYEVFSDEIFYQDQKSRNNPLLSYKLTQSSTLSFTIFGFTSSEESFETGSIEKMKENYLAQHEQNLNHFHLELNQDHEQSNEIEKFNILCKWFVHNALIHYGSPHGLEQYGGGGWGTRDVCQGPIELFETFTRYDLVKATLLKVYERQFFETGDWPQWFLKDKFSYIQADSSHGDIIVWPLLALAKYINATGDKEILNIKVPFTTLKTAEKINEATIYQHVVRQVETIKQNFIKGTYLSCYGGGDWDDTLQPSNRDLTKYLVSGWTVALTIEALDLFNEVVDESYSFKDLTLNIKKDYQKYLICDNIPAGFIYMGEQIKYMLHPRDEETGIKYRLLPFNRGMIAELFDEEMIYRYLDLIDEHLMHMDGVRLMNTTVKYQGGSPKTFVRAETATNFGREIGLMYVHAHIRYLEAMAKIGEADRLYHGLKVINPILIQENVNNAITRQSNMYFSSSDGAFLNRYEADQNFDKLRTGNVKVKAGWRLYSSGPGIYLNQLIRNFLGIKCYQNSLYLDPVLPVSLSGLRCQFDFQQYHLDITYQISGVSGVEYVMINGKRIDRNTAFTRYRRSGVTIPRSYLKEHNTITVYM